MSVELVKKQINEFLRSQDPEVLAIRGAWGVGKTFTWNEFLKEAAHCDEVALKRYSYVSLFGVNSLDNLKFSIFEQVVDIDAIDHKPSIETFRKSTESLSKSLGRKSIRVIQGLPYVKNVSLALEAVSFLSLKNTIVCLDDLERKGDGLRVRDILGLVSLLKEQKDCKVVLILNDNSFEESEGDQLERYREKVIDLDVLFSPTPEECSNIALNDEFEYIDVLRRHVINLGISNIRIIRKMLYLAKKLVRIIKSFEPEVVEQSLHSLTLFSLCYFQRDDDSIPSFVYLKNLGYALWGLDDKEKDEKEKAWNSFLTSYGFRNCDEFDLEIANGVERGFFDEVTLISEAKKLNDEVIANKSQSSFSQAWKKYHETFADNEKDLIDSMYESFKENSKYISPINLNGTVKLFRDLGYDKKADEIIDIYVSEREDNPRSLNLKAYPFSGDMDDPTVRERFEEVSQKDIDRRSLEEVVRSVVGKNGWNPSDIEVLSKASVDDFYSLFKETTGPDLIGYVEVCMQFQRIVNVGEKEKRISDVAKESLVKIGSESELNRRRVSKFGIKVDGKS